MSDDVEVAIVLDCADPERLARFWAEALRYDVLGGAGAYVMLAPGNGRTGPQFLLQRVAEPKTTKNRMHVDVHTADVDGEVERLVALGARRSEDTVRAEHGGRWIVMTDPEGNEFCVCDGGCAC
jgi:predicted enzyme related to lactoylglutathione lyase